MSEYFNNNVEEKKFIPPDYSEFKGDTELPFDSDIDDDDEEDTLDFDDDELDEDNNIESYKPELTKMSEGFSSPGMIRQAINSPWDNNNVPNRVSGNDFWSNISNNAGNTSPGNYYGSSNIPQNGWSNANSSRSREAGVINRDKKVLFIDFIDGLMETYQSNGQPGFLPRAVYDLKPRFDVWVKLSAFSPDHVFAIIQKEFLNDINGIDGWKRVLEGWCCSVSSFLKKPFGSTQILLSTSIYQPKEYVIGMTLRNFKKEDCIFIGLQSGLANQSNQDLVVAQKCGIDYLDLGELLSNMY